MTVDLSRYVRQMRYAPLGEAGQRRLVESRVLLCGCGALGTVLANTLVRAGVGLVRIVDRDFVETTNLQRQVLFDEQDVADALPKAIAAARKLERINSEVTVEPVVADVDHTNVEQFAAGMDLLLDGTDNFETRFLLNDVALKHGIPWVFGGCLGAEGQSMTILPGETACLRCLIPDPPPPGTTPTCDTAGILASIIQVTASIEATEAIKILSGNTDAVSRALAVIDLWENRFTRVDLTKLAASSNCRACKQGHYDWLDGEATTRSVVLCGRNAVQLNPPDRSAVSLDLLAEKLREVGTVKQNPFLLRVAVDAYQLTIFPDGRAIIGGTDDITTARAVYARYVGN
ncbi:MAG: ThiF family adenylyltransferase [Pirellulales bacterium]|nr:ThiF family adenylyltransferase [Planctomycetales bacterium]